MKCVIVLLTLSVLVACGTTPSGLHDTKPLITNPAQSVAANAMPTASGVVVLSSTAMRYHTLDAAKAAKSVPSPSVQGSSRRYAPGPDHGFVTYNVIKDHGDVVEISHHTLTPLAQSQQCTGQRDDSYDAFSAVTFVPKSALTPVLNKSVTRTYDDGTSYTLTAGVPLKRFDAGPIKGWVGIAHDYQFPVKITPKDMSLSVPSVTPLPRPHIMTRVAFPPNKELRWFSTSSLLPLGVVHQVSAIEIGGKPAWSAPQGMKPAGYISNDFGVIQKMSKTTTGDTLVTLRHPCLEVTAKLDITKNKKSKMALIGPLGGITGQNTAPIIWSKSKAKMFWKSVPKAHTAISTKQARVYLVGDTFCTKPGVLGFANERLCVLAKDVTWSCPEHQGWCPGHGQ